MTVRELIEELKKLPQDIPVITMSERIDEVRYRDDYYDGDPANPKCKQIEVVEIV